MPKQIIHNDICPSNLILKKDEKGQYHVGGLIDFGDLIYSHRILDLVIVCARANMNPQKPLRNLLFAIKKYNEIIKLSQEESELLFPLIKIRLAFICLKSCYLSQ